MMIDCEIFGKLDISDPVTPGILVINDKGPVQAL
jgi:hypothetical protein